MKGGDHIEPRDIVLEDYEIIQKKVDEYHIENSKMAFANLYSYKFLHYPRIWFSNDSLIVFCTADAANPCIFPPLCSEDELISMINLARDYFERTFNSPLRIRDCDETFICKMKNAGFRFKRHERRDQWEYIYSSQNLSELKGRSLHKRRNRINKFLSSFPNYRYARMNDSHKEQVLEFHDYWCRLRDCESDETLEYEKDAIITLFEIMEAVPIYGGLILIDGEVKGFQMGTRLNKDTYVTLVEKAELAPEYDGIYAMLNRDTASDIREQFRFVNRQQDMGVPGLRKAKLSWKPEKLLVCDMLMLEE